MSFLLALAAAATAPTPPPSPDVGQEIVVIGKKLRNWKGGVSKVGGRMICKTSKTSGDRRIDAIRCGAMLTCTRPLESRIDALMASDRSGAEKKRAFDALLQGAVPCLNEQEQTGIARLAEERAQS